MTESIHDILIKQVESRYIPEGFIPLPDLLDVLLAYCRFFYEENARSVTIELINHQKAKGLEKYGAPLTLETRIDGARYLMEELVDAVCYQRYLGGHVPINEALDRASECLERSGDHDAALTLMKLNRDLGQTAHDAAGYFLEEELSG